MAEPARVVSEQSSERRTNSTRPNSTRTWSDVVGGALDIDNIASAVPRFESVEVTRNDFYETLRNEWLYSQTPPTSREIAAYAELLSTAHNHALIRALSFLDNIAGLSTRDADYLLLHFQKHWGINERHPSGWRGDKSLDIKLTLHTELSSYLDVLPENIRETAISTIVDECGLILLRTPLAQLEPFEGEHWEHRVLSGADGADQRGRVPLLSGFKMGRKFMEAMDIIIIADDIAGGRRSAVGGRRSAVGGRRRPGVALASR